MFLYLIEARKPCIATGSPRRATPAVLMIELQGFSVRASEGFVVILPTTFRIGATPSEHLDVLSAQTLLPYRALA
jgi:hypothetical protein